MHHAIQLELCVLFFFDVVIFKQTFKKRKIITQFMLQSSLKISNFFIYSDFLNNILTCLQTNLKKVIIRQFICQLKFQNFHNESHSSKYKIY